MMPLWLLKGLPKEKSSSRGDTVFASAKFIASFDYLIS